MKKLVLMLAVLLVATSVPAWAQDEFPKAEVFGGFSVLSMGGGERWNPLGFQASVAGNFHKNFGIVGDFGGQFKDGVQAYEYMGGPRFTARMQKATAFAHALFGGMTVGNGGGYGSNFAMGFGGGVDVNVHDRFAIRVIQFDWLPVIDWDGNWHNDQIRFGLGIVLK